MAEKLAKESVCQRGVVVLQLTLHAVVRGIGAVVPLRIGDFSRHCRHGRQDLCGILGSCHGWWGAGGMPVGCLLCVCVAQRILLIAKLTCESQGCESLCACVRVPVSV